MSDSMALIGEGFDTIALELDLTRDEVRNCTSPIAARVVSVEGKLDQVLQALTRIERGMASIVTEREHDRTDAAKFQETTNKAIASIRKSLPNGLKPAST